MCFVKVMDPFWPDHVVRCAIQDVGMVGCAMLKTLSIKVFTMNESFGVVKEMHFLGMVEGLVPKFVGTADMPRVLEQKFCDARSTSFLGASNQ